MRPPPARRVARLLAAAVALLAAASCAPATPDRPIATALDDRPQPPTNEGGIGGTGYRPPGEPAGTVGLFGTVTGLGSVDLDGLRVAVPQGLAVETLDPALPADAPLAAGDTVAAEAVRAAGGLTARRLVRVVPLLGPVGEVDRAAGTLTVMGTPVRLGGEMPEVGPGDWVAVSGLWRGGAVAASRVERIAPRAQAVASGLLRGTAPRWLMGGTAVEIGCCAARPPDAPRFVTVAGRYEGGRLVAERVAARAATLFPRPLDRLVVEAFLARNPDGSGFHLSGFGIPMDRGSTVPTTVGRRSIFAGRYGAGGTFLIERSLPVPEAADERRRLLEGLPGGGGGLLD